MSPRLGRSRPLWPVSAVWPWSGTVCGRISEIAPAATLTPGEINAINRGELDIDDLIDTEGPPGNDPGRAGS